MNYKKAMKANLDAKTATTDNSISRCQSTPSTSTTLREETVNDSNRGEGSNNLITVVCESPATKRLYNVEVNLEKRGGETDQSDGFEDDEVATRRMFEEAKAAALAWDSGQEDRENYEKDLENAKKEMVKDHRSSDKIHKKGTVQVDQKARRRRNQNSPNNHTREEAIRKRTKMYK